MYANARLSKPRKQLSATSRTPRSSRDDFQVGTLRPSLSTFSPNSTLPRHYETRLSDVNKFTKSDFH